MRQDILEDLKTDFDEGLSQLYAACNSHLKLVRRGIKIGLVSQESFDNNDEMQGLVTRAAYNLITQDGGVVFMFIQSHAPDEIEESIWQAAVTKIELLTQYAFKGAAYWSAQAKLAAQMNADFEAGEKPDPYIKPSPPKPPESSDPFMAAKNRMKGGIQPEDLN